MDELIGEQQPDPVTLRQTLKVGVDLRQRLDRVASAEGGMDGGYLGKKIIREWLEAHEGDDASVRALPRCRHGRRLGN